MNIETENIEHESSVKWWDETTPRRNFEMVDRVRKFDKARPQTAQKGAWNRVWNTRRNDEPMTGIESQIETHLFHVDFITNDEWLDKLEVILIELV
jgi:hypothetical protein